MTQACADCGAPVSQETGITLEIVGDVHTYYCPDCRPPGRGYTLSDLQAMKAETQVQRELARADRELIIIEAGGFDVLDHLQGRSR